MPFARTPYTRRATLTALSLASTAAALAACADDPTQPAAAKAAATRPSLATAVAAPVLQVMPAELSYGEWKLEPPGFMEGKTLPIEITNTGTADLLITSHYTTGHHPGDFVPGSISPAPGPRCAAGVPIAPGATCLLLYQFIPQALGSRWATVVVESNAGSGATYVDGVGVANANLGVEIEYSPGTAMNGKPLTYTYILRNWGPSAAAGTVLRGYLHSSETFSSLKAPSDFACTTPPVGKSGVVTCTAKGDYAYADGQNTRSFQVVVKVAGKGPYYTDSATVGATTLDAYPGNNASRVVVPVGK